MADDDKDDVAAAANLFGPTPFVQSMLERMPKAQTTLDTMIQTFIMTQAAYG